MKILIVADLHHPEELAKARQAPLKPEDQPLLFPPSQGAFFWTRALRRLGHQVEAFIRSDPALFGARASRLNRFTGRRGLGTLATALAQRAPRLHPDYRLRNRRFYERVARMRPDAIFLTGGNWVIYPETVAAVKAEFGPAIVYLSGVSPIVFSNAIERAAARSYDLVIVNDRYHGIQWRELGARRMETLPMSACDPEFHHTFDLTDAEREQFACDVGFVGTLIPSNLYGERIAALEALRDFDLGIWSVHEVPPALRPYYRGPALGEQMLRVTCGARLTVNTHGDFMRYGGNMRLFEACGVGTFQIADDRPGVSEWFVPGEHLVTYRDHDHLRELVATYLAHDDERGRIAAAGQAHVHAHHTYDQRMARLMALVEEIRAS
jgi:hypothetical protein